MNEIKIDPNLGDWTPELVAHNVNELSDSDFIGIYGMDKQEASLIAGLITEYNEDELKKFLQPVEVEVEPEESDSIQFNPENQEHLEDKKNLHWKKFTKKYGVKPNEL